LYALEVPCRVGRAVWLAGARAFPSAVDL